MKVINVWVFKQTGEITPKPMGIKNDSYIIYSVTRERVKFDTIKQIIIYGKTKFKQQELF